MIEEKTTRRIFFAVVGTIIIGVGFLATKPPCPTRAVAFFSGYAGGWYCLATVEPRR